MANALTYIKNVGKSVGYVSVNVFKEKNPVFADFAETNGELMTDMYKSVKDLKKNIKNLPNAIMESKYGEFGKTYLVNLFDDLKTGKFYNKEREDEYMNIAADSFADGEDMSVFDDFGDIDIGNLDEDNIISTNEMMDIVGEKSSTAVSTAVARSAEYIVHANTQSAKASYNQMNAIYGGLHTGMSTINQNISKVLEFFNENMNLHIENSKTFYTEMTRMNQEQTQYLKEISETLKVMNEPPKAQEYKRTRYNDLISSEGVIDLGEYIKFSKKNLAENSGLGMIIDAIKMAESAGGLKTFAASPLQFAVEGMVNAIIPKALDKSMETLNKSLSGLAANLLMSIRQKAENGIDESPVWSILNDIFGINTERRVSIDPRQYEKGKVPFDGITRKAIIEVIPTYLSKILSALTGQKRDTFDYDSGKFVYLDKMKKDIDDMTTSGARSAASDMDRVFNQKVGSLGLSDEELKAFKEFWKEAQVELYKDQKRLETRDKNFTLNTYDPSDDYKFTKLLKQIFDGTAENMAYANRMYSQIASQSRQMESKQGSSSITALFNDSVKEGERLDSGISAIFGNANQAIVDKLNEIHKELAYIRVFGVGGSGKSSNNSNSYTPKTDFHDWSIPKRREKEDKTQSNKQESLSQDKEEAAPSVVIPKDEKLLTLEDIETLNQQWKDYHKYEKNPELFGKIPPKPEISEWKLRNLRDRLEKKEEKENKNKKKTLSDRMADLKKGALGIVQGPMNFAASLIDRVDARLYELIYGPITGKVEREADDRTFKEVFFDKIEESMEKIQTFIQDKIIDPLTTKSLKENAYDAAKKFLNIFGIDLDKTVEGIKKFLFGEDEHGNRTKGGFLGKFVNDFKDAFKSMGEWIKGGFKEAGDWSGVTSKKNEKGQKKEDSNKKKSQGADLFNPNKKPDDKKDGAQILEGLANLATNNKAGETPLLATGARRFNKTGLAIVSEGEMVLPPDMNPFNVSKRLRNENRVKHNLINGINNIFQYNKGTADATSGEGFTKEQLEALKEKKIKSRLDKILSMKDKKAALDEVEKLKKDHPAVANAISKYLKSSTEKYNTDDYEDGRDPLTDRILGAFGSGIASVFGRAKEVVNEHFTISDEDTKKIKDNTTSILKDIFGNTGTLAAGATVGAGVSLFTGLLGGPILGAAIGAGTALLTKSKTVQKMLFGDDEGNQGLLPKNLTDTFKKYIPSMGLGGAMGGIISLIPGIPGGPIAGIIAGSALGFAKKSEKAQDFLFGDGKLLGDKEKFQKKVRSVLPKMGAGALAGIIAGPLPSLSANIILGSAIGFASDTDKFKDAVFGKINEKTGKREGGAIQEITKAIIDPLKTAIDPLKKQFQIIGEHIKDLLDNMFETILGAPLQKFIKQKVIDPLGNFMENFIKWMTKPIKTILSAPFKLIGRVGDSLRKHQIKIGRANYMSAKERNKFRRSKKWKRLGFGKDQFRDFDESLEKMDYNDIGLAENLVTAIGDSKKNIKNLRDSSMKNISGEMFSGDIDVDLGNKAMELVRKGRREDAMKLIKDKDISNKDNILEVLSKESARLKVAEIMDMKIDKSAKADAIHKVFKDLNIKISKAQIRQILYSKRGATNIAKLLGSEKEIRKKEAELEGTPIGSLNDEQKQRHKELLDRIDQIIEQLKEDTDIDSKQYKDTIDNQTRRNDSVAGLSDDPEDADAAPGESLPKNIWERIARTYREKGLVDGTASLGRKGIGKALGFGLDTVGGIFGLTGDTLGVVGKGAKASYRETRGILSLLRNSGLGERILGENTDWEDGELTHRNIYDSRLTRYIARMGGKKFSGDPDAPLSNITESQSELFKKLRLYDNLQVKKENEGESDSINNQIKHVTAIIASMAAKEGIDTTDIDLEANPKQLLNRVKNKFIQENVYETTSDGRVLKYRKDKNGELILDTSSAENREAMQDAIDQKDIQKGILAGIQKLPFGIGNLFGDFFTEKDTQSKSTLSNIAAKAGKAAKVTAAIVAGFGAIGWAKTSIFPVLKSYWDEKLLPYFRESWDGKQDGLGKVIYFFNPENPNGLLQKAAKFVREDLPGIVRSIGGYVKDGFNTVIHDILPTLGTYVADGVSFVLRDVAPAILATLVKQLPKLIWSGVKGVGRFFDQLANGQRPTDGKQEDANLSFSYGINNASTPKWYDKSVATQPKLSTQTTITIEDPQEASTPITQTDIATEKPKAHFKAKDLPKAFKNINKGYKSVAQSEYEKVYSNIVDTPYGKMTVADVLNDDRVYHVTADGTEIRGYDMLNYNNTAKSLGMNLTLSNAEMKRNRKNEGIRSQNVFTDLADAGVRAFTRGYAGTKVGITGGSKTITKVSGILGKVLDNKFTREFIGKQKGAIGLTGKASSIFGNVIKEGGKFLVNTPEKLNRLGQNVFYENLFNKGNTVKNITEKIKNGKVTGKIAKLASKSKLGEFIAKMSAALTGFFKENKIIKYFSDIITKFKGSKAVTKITSESLESFSKFLINKLSDALEKVGAKGLAKAAGKITAYVSTGTLLLVADALISFASGFRNAKSILEITEEPAVWFKVVAGITEAVSSVFCLGLLPTKMITNLIIEGLRLLGVDFSNLDRLREEALEEVRAYNNEKGTDLNVEEYNKKDRLTTKIFKGIRNIFKRDDKVADTANGSAINSVNDKIKNINKLYEDDLYIAKGSGIFKSNKDKKRFRFGRGSNDHQIEGPNFISQVDPKYRSIPFNIPGDSTIQTLGDSGCAPAAAAMAVNSTLGGASMIDASKLALNYKAKDDGVRASYFADEFARYGLQAQYSSSSSDIKNQLKSNKKVVLMGQDRGNTSKANSPFGPNPHYVTATGMSRDGQYVYINDPEASRPNIRYKASKVLGSSKLGIAAAAGSKLISNKFRNYIARGSYGSDTVQYKVWHALRDAGYNEIAVAAAMGNIQHESGFRANAIEKGSGAGFGLVQWTGGRRTAIENYAAQKGVSPSNLAIQIEFLLKELAEGSGIWTNASSEYNFGTLKRSDWANGKDLVKATKAFMCCFERPSYNPNTNHIDRRIQSAQEYYQAFTGQTIDVNWGEGITSNGLDTTALLSNEPSSSGNATDFLGGITTAFSQLANATFNKLYGLNLPTTSDSSSVDYNTSGGLTYNNTVQGASGNVSSNTAHANMQKKLVEQMYAIQGKLRYAQGNSKYPGSRNPEDGSGDCSSTVQWVYKKILGADPGSWTGAQRTDSDTFTVRSGPDAVKDESWLQLGDLLLKDGHVEMYAGNNTTIGHGGGRDGKTLGPTVKKLDKSGKYDLVRRWIGFIDKPGASNKNTFIRNGSNVAASGSGLAYSNALHYIDAKGSDIPTIPLGINNISPNQYNSNTVTSNMPAYSNNTGSKRPTQTTKTNSDMIELIKAIVQLLTSIVTNTAQLNNIVKLLGDFMSATSTAAVNGTKESKENATVAKQTLINAMQNTGASNEPNSQLLRLIEKAEMIAKA